MLLNARAWRLTLIGCLGEKGQGMVEYALVLSFVVVLAVAVSSNNWQDVVTDIFNNMAATIAETSDE